MGILTLTTDFGPDGPYVAAMKGVVLGRAPGATLVDVTHAVAPQNVLEGAFVLSDLVETFPEGTVHLAVVDPGVGTDRRLIAVAVAGQWFVLPDNGLISGVVRNRTPACVWEVSNPALRRPTVSSTFHGRDVLAPAAAHLLLGREPDELGPVVESFLRLPNFRAAEDGADLVGEVIFRDAFGNLITNIDAGRLATGSPGGWTIDVAGVRVGGLARTYGENPDGALVALIGSAGWLEIAVVNGDAARTLAAGPGSTVRVRKTG